jgi:uncharacterized protein YecE (DUF72 family)
VDLYVGTSGFSYKEWKGKFYPADLPAKDWLTFYADRFPSVEINNTFYRMPKREVLASWAEQVPETFRFVVKAPRRITHIKRLKDVDAEAAFLFENLSALGDRLGAILVQLPPNLPKDVERLEKFLAAVPDGIAAAFEFRNPSWHAPEVLDRLRERDFALAAVDAEEFPDPPLVPTASWGYLRLRRLDYDESGLRSWADRIAATGWKRAFLFFKHEDEGRGPVFAELFSRVSLGPVSDPPRS